MSSDDAELAHHIAQLKGIEVLFIGQTGATCDGCGTSPGREQGDVSVCRDPTGEYDGILYLCNDCIAESWARAPSQRVRRTAAEMAAEEEMERERERIETFRYLIKNDPEVHGILRDITMGRPAAAELAAGRGLGLEDGADIGADS